MNFHDCRDEKQEVLLEAVVEFDSLASETTEQSESLS